MGFFGIGGSNKKKDEAAEGIVHDTKRDAPDESKNILDEFEAQFSQGGPVQASNDTPSPAVQQAASSASHEDFKPPSAPEKPQAPSKPAQAPSPHAPASPPARPTHPPSAPPRQAPEPPAPHPRSSPEPSSHAPEHHAPSPSGRDDLPDFDFDFHPSQPEAHASSPQPPHPQSPPPKRVPPPQPPPEQHERAPSPKQSEAPRQMPSRSDRFDLPDFSSEAFEPKRMPSPQRMPERSNTWDDLTAPRGTKPWQEPSPRPEPLNPTRAPPSEPRSKPPVHQQAPQENEAQEVVMRGGTLYIEKHALVRHVHDLNDLKGLSTSTDELFKRVDSLSQEEKKALDKMQSAIHALHDTLEQTDELLFKGE